MKPTINSHTITHGLFILMVFMNRKRFARSHQPTRKPKLGGSVCLFQRTTDRQSVANDGANRVQSYFEPQMCLAI